jgi:hypothetical protein
VDMCVVAMVLLVCGSVEREGDGRDGSELCLIVSVRGGV